MGDGADRTIDNGMMEEYEGSDRGDDDYSFFKGTKIIRESERAVLVKLRGGRQGWIPKSCLDQDPARKVGATVELAVKHWFAEKMEPGGEWGAQQAQKQTEYVEIPGAFIVRESAKAIQVRIDGRPGEMWFPVGQIDPESPVRHDGDPKGILRVSKWIAGEKGFGKEASGVERTAQDDIRQPAKPKFQTPDPDDDIPF